MLDVGAHCGLFSRVASNIIRDGRIVAIEPNTDISAFLQANLAEADVQIRSIAISDKDGKGTLHKGNAAETSLSSLSYAVGSSDESPVELRSLDSFCSEENLSHIDLLKLDVEGSEVPALKGATGLLSRRAVLGLFVELTPKNLEKAGHTRFSLIGELVSQGYQPYRLAYDFIGLVPFDPSIEKPYDNLFFTYDLAEVNARLQGCDGRFRRCAEDIFHRGRAAENVEIQATKRLELLLLEKAETTRLRQSARKSRGTIFTSLPPTTKRMVGENDFGPSYQLACLQSWVNAGFEVRSINPAHEIDALAPFNYPVTFIECESSRPRIVDFIGNTNDAPTEIVGIVNADCLLLNSIEPTRSDAGPRKGRSGADGEGKRQPCYLAPNRANLSWFRRLLLRQGNCQVFGRRRPTRGRAAVVGLLASGRVRSEGLPFVHDGLAPFMASGPRTGMVAATMARYRSATADLSRQRAGIFFAL